MCICRPAVLYKGMGGEGEGDTMIHSDDSHMCYCNYTILLSIIFKQKINNIIVITILYIIVPCSTIYNNIIVDVLYYIYYDINLFYIWPLCESGATPTAGRSRCNFTH